jgi:hypothetical protein
MKNIFTKFMALHEFCEFHRKAMLFATLGTSEGGEGR